LRAVFGQQVPQNDLSVETVASVKTAASDEASVESVASAHHGEGLVDPKVLAKNSNFFQNIICIS
jgi:hypothetical protein